MKLAALVILYHPPESALSNIATYYDWVDKLYVFDNTETTSCKALFAPFTKAIFLHDGQNKGIAQRLNEGCRLALQDGFNWLLTMDQDSRFPQGTFPIYQHCISAYPQPDKVAAFGMQYKTYDQPSTGNCDYKLTPFIITSGMLLHLPVVAAVGGFDEQLFIDAVDHEFCIRAGWKGYQTVRFKNIFLHHAVGIPIKRAALKTLYLVKKAKAVHSPLRCYYMYRNALYLAQKYRSIFPQIIAHNDKVVRANLNRNFWYGRSAWQTLRYILKAKLDFKKGQMGKINSTK